ncbi:MAG: hypothetical protein KGJ07_07470 [Patescibacteria group bacterium]|nr:hypothetical protein [Patescibacteria group bacterium]
MPINVPLIKSLQKKYGMKRGTSVYFGMENKGSKAFKKGVKTAKKQGRTVAHLKNLRKGKKKRG